MNTIAAIDKNSLADVIKDILTNDISPINPVVRFSVETGIFKIESSLFDEDDDQITFNIEGFGEFLSDFDWDSAIEKYITEQEGNINEFIKDQYEYEQERKEEENNY